MMTGCLCEYLEMPCRSYSHGNWPSSVCLLAHSGGVLLQGFVDRKTGKAELTFLADFFFTAGPLYKASHFFLQHVMKEWKLMQGSCIVSYVALSSACQHDFSVMMQAPPLVVTTLLTTESVQGDVQGGTGKRMDERGFAK